MKPIFIFFLLIIGVNAVEKARFDNYRVYEVKIEDEKQMELIHHINDHPNGYEALRLQAGKIDPKAHIMVAPHKFGEWSDYVEKFNLKVQLLTKNLQENMDKERERPLNRATLDWSFYWTLDEVNQWIDGMVAQHPASITHFLVGQSYENRPIRALRVNIGGGSNKKAIIVESAIHSNEWITTASMTYLLNEFFTSTNPGLIQVAQRYIWYFVFVANPDGYVHTFTTDRLWRKNRRPSGNGCFGIDPNRNWDRFWATGGHSNDPCHINYAGPFPFSEPETRSLAEYYTTIPNRVAYFAMHSFGQMLLTPHGYSTVRTPSFSTLLEIGHRSIESLTAIFGTHYVVAGITDVFGILTGNSIDWVYDILGVNITYTFEFRDRGVTGFVLPPQEIIPNSIEIVACIVRLMQEAYNRGIA